MEHGGDEQQEVTGKGEQSTGFRAVRPDLSQAGAAIRNQVWKSGPRVLKSRGTKRENQKQGHFKRQGKICDCKEEDSHMTAELAVGSCLEKYLNSTASAASSRRFYTCLLLTVMTT